MVRIERNHDGSYLLTFVGVRGPDGYSLRARCVSIRSIKATLKRWRRQHGRANGLTFTDSDTAFECGKALVGVESLA